ncbi:hypothetical protein Hdeb2414_s0006g00215311 [Helianthus debilis subsp. tardiflorus]
MWQRRSGDGGGVKGDGAVTPTTGVTPATTSGGGDGGLSLQPMKMMRLAGEGSRDGCGGSSDGRDFRRRSDDIQNRWWSRCRLRHGIASARIWGGSRLCCDSGLVNSAVWCSGQR